MKATVMKPARHDALVTREGQQVLSWRTQRHMHTHAHACTHEHTHGAHTHTCRLKLHITRCSSGKRTTWPPSSNITSRAARGGGGDSKRCQWPLTW